MINRHICDCIVPFYQEKQRATNVVKTLLRLGCVGKIICVDDGSTDKTHLHLDALSPRVLVIRHRQNLGKLTAVKTGCSYTQAEHVLLVDSDLQNLSAAELKQGLDHYFNDPDTKMLLFKRKNEVLLSRLLRFNVVFTGERILAACDLQKILKKPASGYQLEYLINQYMIDQDKKVLVYNISALNTHKPQKFGYVQGVSKELAMYVNMKQRAQPKHFFYQLTYFAREELN